MDVTARNLTEIGSAITYVVQQVSAIVGGIFVVILILIGINILRSSTNERRYEESKASLQRAAVGAGVAWAAYFIAGVVKAIADKLPG